MMIFVSFPAECAEQIRMDPLQELGRNETSLRKAGKGCFIMAMNDEIREQRKKLKGKGIKAHFSWFWEYEKVPALIVVLVGGLVISLIYHYATYKPYVFGAMFLNASVQDTQSEDLSADFMEYAGIDAKESDVFTDLSEILTLGNNLSSEYDMYSTQKIMAQTAAGQIDVAVMDAWYFDHYAYNGEFKDLREVLDEDTMKKYEDRIYYIDRTKAVAMQDAQDNKEGTDTAGADSANGEDDEETARAFEKKDGFVNPDPADMEDPLPVGIICTDAPYIEKNGNYPDTVCIYGIVANTKHPETCQQFLEYLFEK